MLSLELQYKIAEARYEVETEAEKELCEIWLRLFGADKEKSHIDYTNMD